MLLILSDLKIYLIAILLENVTFYKDLKYSYALEEVVDYSPIQVISDSFACFLFDVCCCFENKKILLKRDVRNSCLSSEPSRKLSKVEMRLMRPPVRDKT